jgi:hypothetical protein
MSSARPILYNTFSRFQTGDTVPLILADESEGERRRVEFCLVYCSPGISLPPPCISANRQYLLPQLHYKLYVLTHLHKGSKDKHRLFTACTSHHLLTHNWNVGKGDGNEKYRRKAVIIEFFVNNFYLLLQI